RTEAGRAHASTTPACPTLPPWSGGNSTRRFIRSHQNTLLMGTLTLSSQIVKSRCHDAHQWPDSLIRCDGLPASSPTEILRASAMATATDGGGCPLASYGLFGGTPPP